MNGGALPRGLRGARARAVGAWASGGGGTRAALAVAGVAAAALIGAFLFGAWHVLVGGFVKGNWRAGAFGVALAAASGALLWIEVAVGRRLLTRGPGRS
ncbi:MAG: hypothetical protein M0T75_02690 [Chloroflexi bacterium]|nr:hypothetical protein [Chloroflexota bacterium]